MAEIVHTAVQCEFCEHFYVKPCSASTKATCPNYKFKIGSLAGQDYTAKAITKPKVERVRLEPKKVVRAKIKSKPKGKKRR